MAWRVIFIRQTDQTFRRILFLKLLCDKNLVFLWVNPLELEEQINIMKETTLSPPQQSKQIELIQEEVVLEEIIQEEVVKRKKVKNTQRKIEPITPQTQDAIVSIEIEEELEI